MIITKVGDNGVDVKLNSANRSVSTSSIIADIIKNHSLTIDISDSVVDDFDLDEIKKEWMIKYPGEKFIPDLIANRTTFKCAVKIEKQRIGYLSMKQATFWKEVSFLSVTFIQEISFEKAQFKSNANFLLRATPHKKTSVAQRDVI